MDGFGLACDQSLYFIYGYNEIKMKGDPIIHLDETKHSFWR